MKTRLRIQKLLLATVGLTLSFPLVTQAQNQSPVVENGSQILQTESRQQSDWRFVRENNQGDNSPLDIDAGYNLNQENVELSTTESEERWGNKGDRSNFSFSVPVEEF